MGLSGSIEPETERVRASRLPDALLLTDFGALCPLPSAPASRDLRAPRQPARDARKGRRAEAARAASARTPSACKRQPARSPTQRRSCSRAHL